MDRAYITSICSIVVIVAIVAWSVSGPSVATGAPTRQGTLGGNAFQVAVAEGAPVSSEPLEPLRVTAQANGGTLLTATTVVIGEDTMRYYTDSGKPSTLQAIAFELAGSAQARESTFTIARTTTPDWANPSSAMPLVSTQSNDGTWYSALSHEQLSTIKAMHGAGWYVLTGVATRGNERAQSSFTLFLQ